MINIVSLVHAKLQLQLYASHFTDIGVVDVTSIVE